MQRITICVPDEIASKAQRAVAAAEAESVSAYFVGVAAREPDRADTTLANLVLIPKWVCMCQRLPMLRNIMSRDHKKRLLVFHYASSEAI